MLQKILKRITNNFGLKVLAAVIAIVFWLVIVNIEDPEKTESFVVNVEIQDQEYLEEQGKTYEVIDNSDMIKIYVTGQRSIVERLTASDFTVTASLSEIENNSQLPITITAKKYGDEISITNRSQYVEVFVEDLVSETFDIEIETTGEVSEGFQVSELQSSHSIISVRGPESVVETIARAVALVDVSAIQADVSQKAAIALYDVDGDIVDVGRLALSRTEVIVSVGILESTTVPVVYNVNGEPEDGYRVVSAEGSIGEVAILGKPEIIQEINSIVVNGSEMNISGATGTVEKTINITDFLPEGTTLADDQEELVKVTITMEQETTQSFDMAIENISVQNVPNGYQVTIVQNTVPVTIKGYPSELEEITVSGLKGTVNAAGVTENTTTLNVTISGEYQVEGTIQVAVEVTKQSSEGAEQNPNDTPEA